MLPVRNSSSKWSNVSVPAGSAAPHERNWQDWSGWQVGVVPPVPRPNRFCSGMSRLTSSNVVLLESW